MRTIKTARTHIGRDEVVAAVTKDDVPHWALEFALLSSGLAAAIQIVAEDGPTIALFPHEDHDAKHGVALRVDPDKVELTLAANQLEHLEAVLLRAYRDGVAEASHVHSELDREDGSFDLTILFEHHREPMSAEEASLLILGE